jgi:hypothetical protein
LNTINGQGTKTRNAPDPRAVGPFVKIKTCSDANKVLTETNPTKHCLPMDVRKCIYISQPAIRTIIDGMTMLLLTVVKPYHYWNLENVAKECLLI